MNEIIYGIRSSDGKIISIDDVPLEEAGGQCGCKCAACGNPLQACSLNGKVRRYFRHHVATRSGAGGGNCNATDANETALHNMAKQIIAEKQIIFVPARHISTVEAGVLDLPSNVLKSVAPYEYQPARQVTCTSVALEKTLGNFKPDVVAQTSHRELLVEIFVRHKVDDKKIAKAKEYGAAMLEVDLSAYAETPISYEQLCDLIVAKADCKEWAFYPLSEKALQTAKQYYESLPVVKQYLHQHAIEIRKNEIARAQNKRRADKVQKLFQPANYAAELNRLRDDALFQKTYEEVRASYWYPLRSPQQKSCIVPFYVNLPITGEMIFQCDRRLWQSILFNRFIYGRKGNRPHFNIEKMFATLKNDHHIKVDYDLAHKLPHPLYEDEVLRLSQSVVRKYFNYLELIGFIVTLDNEGTYKQKCWKTVLTTHTLQPPDTDGAEALQAALQNVDVCSPDIDNLIYEQLRPYYHEKRKRALEAIAEAERQEREKRAAQQAAAEQERLQELKLRKIISPEIGPRWMYEAGLEQVKNYDFYAQVYRYDRFNKPWALCTKCNEIKPRAWMDTWMYGTGICRECAKAISEKHLVDADVDANQDTSDS